MKNYFLPLIFVFNILTFTPKAEAVSNETKFFIASGIAGATIFVVVLLLLFKINDSNPEICSLGDKNCKNKNE